MIHRLVPRWIVSYQLPWLGADVIAGLTVTALLVPEGMAYAQLAGMPPETAFYAAPIGLLAYALLGSSRQLVVAVSSTVAVVSAATISEIADAGSADYIALTAALALVAGVISMLAGLARLGRLAQFFSESVLTGFVFGLALIISVKQVPKILGIEAEEGNFFERLVDIIVEIGDAHIPTVVVGLATIVLMVGLEHWFERIPAALVALLGGILAGELLDLAADDVEIVGEVPSGLVGPAIPNISGSDVTLLIIGGLGIAVISFAEAIGPVRSFATKHHYDVDVDKELVGLGAANLGAGLFQGFPVGSSLSKSAANEAAGARSPLSSIVAAAITAFVALFLTGIFRNLPEATLGAIVIVAISGMMNVAEMRRLWRLRRTDFLLAAVALVGVLAFDALPGLGIAVLVSIAAVVWESATPRLSVMGRAPGEPALVRADRHPRARVLDGLLLVRVDENMFFANAVAISDSLKELIDRADPRPITVVLDLEASTAIDVPACDSLRALAEELGEGGIVLSLARVHGPVSDMLERAGVLDVIGTDRLFPHVLGAIAEHVDRSGNEPEADFVAAIAQAELEALANRLPGRDQRLRNAIAALQNDDGDEGQ
ncbi:MAG: SulP family inorganic anion transporter [Actinomycetia bacterium]|nr:SulP family inorganic anion transporter [Actinomycetes bacterium]